MSSKLLLCQSIFKGNQSLSNGVLCKLNGNNASAFDSKPNTSKGLFAQSPCIAVQRISARDKTKSAAPKVESKEKSTAEELKFLNRNKKDQKVTLVGSGNVAETSTWALVATGTTKEVCILGLDKTLKLKGEETDMRHASIFPDDHNIVCSKVHADSKGSEICVITTDSGQGAHEDNYEFTARNAGITRAVVQELMKYNPDAMFAVASDPVDVLTRGAWLAGGMHKNRIMGTGNNLYTAMLRQMTSSRMRVHTSASQGLVLGQNNSCSNPFADSGGDGGHCLCRAAGRKAVGPPRSRLSIGLKFDRNSSSCNEAMCTTQKLFQNISNKCRDTNTRKVTVVGIGQVGITAAFAMMFKNVSNNISLVDISSERLQSELLDLSHASAFLRDPKIQASTDYSITAGSAICVICAGVRQLPTQTRLDIVQPNVELLKVIIPKLLKYSPDTILLMATNPCDVLTWAAWKLSKLPKNRVIGSGCLLDSARFRYFVAKKMNIAPSSVNGYIIGEHGDSSVPVWSALSVGGVRLKEINRQLGDADDPECWRKCGEDVVKGAASVIKGKGYTNWAVGMAIMEICHAILDNNFSIYPVSTYITGLYGINETVFISLPAVLGRQGVIDIIKLRLSCSEVENLRKSAMTMHKVQMGIKW